MALAAGIAAGHPATVDAGLDVLGAGGSAADAAVAASLASCVAETVMTGLLGGGHAIYWDASERRAWNLDCFVAAPGLGAQAREVELLHLDVPFGAELVHYAVGPASCGVPGLPAGLEALWARHGRLPWARIVEPALRLARDGTDFPPAHAACLAMLAPVMTMDSGARIYTRGARLLSAGERLEQPGLVSALELVRDEGAATVYRGGLADALVDLSDDRGGLLTRADLEAYRARWLDPVEVAYHEHRVLTREGLSGVPAALARLPRLRGRTEAERVPLLLDAVDGAAVAGHTTNLVTADAEGNACVLTTSLGLGSGDFLPGLDLHLNSMLGEADLIRGTLDPGERMGSMMAPMLALRDESVVLAIGAAGGTRLRTALVGVAAAVLDEGLAAQAAVDRPRAHRAGRVVNSEPGVDEAAIRVLQATGHEVRRWPDRHHYFGGVSLITPSGGAGDPRRSGVARGLW